MGSGKVSIQQVTCHFTPLYIHMCRCAGSREIRRPLVKRHGYRERDYAFAQLVLTLRTAIGLTQLGLAERLGVSRPAVADWEGA
jgi:hypothetical protein